MQQSDPSHIKAHLQSTQSNAAIQSLQKSLNPSLLPAAVFQLGFSAKPQHRIIICIILFIILNFTSIAQPNVPKPQFNSFQTVTIPQQQTPSITQFQQQLINNPLLPVQDQNITLQNHRIMQQSGMTLPGQTHINQKQNQAQQLEEFKREELKESYNNSMAHFQSYLTQFLQLNPNNFSITKAVYLCEAVYYNNPVSYNDFLRAIQQKANFVKLILKQEGLSIKNGFAVHYAIQKLFSQSCIINQTNNKQLVIKKIEYDFDDFFGDKDYTKMFVTKLLQTNSGQCRSMPLLYLCIAEQLNTKAWLSLAPQHSFIKFYDDKNKLSNFEATNGHLVSTTWLLQSNAISSIALKNKTYLDTLSSKKLFAQCLADLQMCYLVKFGYTDFTEALNKQILAIDSSNINALMYNNNTATFNFKQLQKQYNNPTQQQIQNNSILSKAFIELQQAQQKVNDLGYQDMPKEQYIQWLQSIEIEKAKQKTKTK